MNKQSRTKKDFCIHQIDNEANYLIEKYLLFLLKFTFFILKLRFDQLFLNDTGGFR